MIFEAFAWYFAWKEFEKNRGEKSYFKAVREEKDPTTFVVLFEDSAAMLGLIVAFIGVWLVDVTGILLFDGLASIAIGIILAVTAGWLAYETKGLLIGESASNHVIDGVTQIAASYSGIKSVNETLTMHVGPKFILLNLSLDFNDDLDVRTVESSIADITTKIKERYPRIKRVFIEAEKMKQLS